MGMITTKDGAEIFYKDWGDGQPIVFHHGWPLSADDWDAQMLFFLARGYRVIAHDRRGHGRSTQTATGHDMDTYAADVAAVVDASRPEGRDPCRPLDRRRRGRPLCRAPRQRPRRQGGADQRGAADHGEDRTRIRAAADRGVRRLPRRTCRQPRAVLPRRRRWPVLRLQPPGREGLARRHRQLVAPGHDGRRQGALRVHQGVLGDRLHRGSEDDRRARRWSCTATTTRSCRSPTPRCCRSKLLKNGTLKIYPGYPHGMCTDARRRDQRGPAGVHQELTRPRVTPDLVRD